MTTAIRPHTWFIPVLALTLSPLCSASAANDPFRLAAPALMETLGASRAAPSEAIEIIVNEIAESPNYVPIQVRSRLPQTESLAVVLENNPTPLTALYRPQGSTEPSLSTRVRISKSTAVHVLVQAGGKTYHASKFIKVTRGGCGDGSIVQSKPVASDVPPGAIKLRAARDGTSWEIKALMQHPNENGLRPINENGDMAPARDSRTGKPILPHYIREVSATLDDKPVLLTEWGPSITVNPFLSFRLREGKPGQKLKLTWKDTQGLTSSAEVRLD